MKVADPWLVGLAGPEMIVVCGGTVSTVQVAVAGDTLVLPTESVALTLKVCEPFARPENAAGEVQAEGAAPSRLHAKLTDCLLAMNEMLALVLDVGLAGDAVMVTTGATVSTTQV